MKVGDTVQLVSNFECDGQEPVPAKVDLRLCSINEFDKIATVEYRKNEEEGGKFPVVPLELLKLKESKNNEWKKEDANLSETGSARFNKGKPEIHQVPYCAIKGMAEALMYGEGKYGKWNWAKGNNFSVPWDSAQRHMWKFISGEDIDKESNIHHIKLALVNLAMLLYYTENNPELDDRSKNE